MTVEGAGNIISRLFLAFEGHGSASGERSLLLIGGDKCTQPRGIREAKELARKHSESSNAKATTRIWDPAEHPQSEEDMAAYLEAALEAALEEGDATLIAAALGDIARAKGMTQLAKETGLGRESLYKALSPAGNPEFAPILRVVSALGLRLHAAPAGPVAAR